MNKALFVALMLVAFILGTVFGVALFTAKTVGLITIAAYIEYYRAHVALFVMNLAWGLRSHA